MEILKNTYLFFCIHKDHEAQEEYEKRIRPLKVNVPQRAAHLVAANGREQAGKPRLREIFRRYLARVQKIAQLGVVVEQEEPQQVVRRLGDLGGQVGARDEPGLDGVEAVVEGGAVEAHPREHRKHTHAFRIGLVLDGSRLAVERHHRYGVLQALLLVKVAPGFREGFDEPLAVLVYCFLLLQVELLVPGEHGVVSVVYVEAQLPNLQSVGIKTNCCSVKNFLNCFIQLKQKKIFLGFYQTDKI